MDHFILYCIYALMAMAVILVGTLTVSAILHVKKEWDRYHGN